MIKKFGFVFGYCADYGLKENSQPKQIITNNQLIFIISCSALVIKVCQGSTKALRNHLQAQNKRDMVKEEEKKFKVPHGVKNEVFPTVA